MDEVILLKEIPVIFLLIICCVNGTSITVAPSSVSALLYTLANFTCVGTGDILSWTVGGNLLTDPSNQDREISVTTNNISVDVCSSVLTIRALPINDGISIECNLISFNPYGFKQKGATLTIKGVSSVEALVILIMNSLSITWSPPSFNSDDIPQWSITTYHVYIQNKDGFIIVNTNTTDTFYGLSNNFTVCDIYTVIVTAFIEQYTSIDVRSTKEYSGNYTIEIQNYTVIFDDHDQKNKFTAQFKLKVNGTPRLCNSLLFGTTEYNNIVTTYHLQYIGNTTNNDDVIICYNITGLDPFNNYTFIVYITDFFNSTKDQDHIMFTIYHVQELTLQYYSDNGSVVVECRFAERSTADGCHVIFRESSEGTLKSINMSKSSLEESRVYQYITLPVSGNYTVTAHDIVDGTIITNPSVVYPQVLEYILLLPSPTETIACTYIISNDEKFSFSSDIFNTTSITASDHEEPASGKSNIILVPRYFYMISGIGIVLIILFIILIFLIYLIVRKRNKQYLTQNQERTIVRYQQTNSNNYEELHQLTTTTDNVTTVLPDPYHISHDELLDLRREHQQPTTSSQVESSPSQPISPYHVILHQAPPTSSESSRTITMAGVSEHDLLLPSNTSSITLCDIEFEELMTKSTSPNNDGPRHNTTYDNIQSYSSQSTHLDKFMKEPTITKDSGISSDPTPTSSNISSEKNTILVISESNDVIINELSEGEKNTCHYAEVGFSSHRPIVPPTSGVPVEYSIIGGHLNTMIIEDCTETFHVSRKEHKVETEYNHPTDNNETSYFANNEILTNLAATRNENEESHQISTTSYHEAVDSQHMHNFDSPPEIISSDPYISQITYSIIKYESDNVSKPKEDSSTPEL